MKEHVLKSSVKIVLSVIIAITCIAAAVMVWMGGRLSPYDVKFDNEHVGHYNYGWTYKLVGQDIELYSMPSKVATDDGSITLHNTLLDIMPNGAALCIVTNQQQITVKVDGEDIYEYGTKLNTIFGKSFGRVQHCIRIPKNNAGKDIEIILSNVYDNNEVAISDILIGSKTSIMFELARSNAASITSSIIFFIFGILLLIWAVVVRASSMRRESGGFLYLGLFCVISAVWIAADTDFLQFFSGNEASPYLTSYFSFMLLPILFLLYIDKICMNGTRIIKLLCALFALNFAVNTLLCGFGVADLAQTVFITHILLVCSICICLWICSREVITYKRREMYEVMVAIIVLIILTLASVVLYYTDSGLGDSQLYIYGLFIFAALLVVNVVRKAAGILSESMEIKVYRRLAYVDMMTSLSNRAAFDIDMAKREKNTKHGKQCTLILCDLNNLKEINDMRGHSLGDLLIKRFGSCLKAVFDGKGKCYRIGGDEFTVIMDNVTDDVIQAYMRDLSSMVEAKNDADRENIKISYAWGMAHAVADADGRFDSKVLFDEADKNMYENKQQMRRDKNNE